MPGKTGNMHPSYHAHRSSEFEEEGSVYFWLFVLVTFLTVLRPADIAAGIAALLTKSTVRAGILLYHPLVHTYIIRP